MGDVYPYTASSTSLRTLLPDWVLEGGVDEMLKRIEDATVRGRIRKEVEAPETGQGLLDRIGWDNIMIAWCPKRQDAEGRRIAEIAAARRLDPLDAVFELLRDAEGVASMIMFQLDEADLRRALAHPHVMIGSDGSALATSGEMSAGKPHPRSYGTFPRVLGEYTREQRVLSLPEAVHKMTGLPARRLGLRDRGVIRVGARADLVVFDPKRIADQATYDDPHRYPVGVEHVLVNGSAVIRDGEHTGSLPGRILTPP
jgi:N-acyl-D-aspartate/D-glutamate deacylase